MESSRARPRACRRNPLFLAWGVRTNTDANGNPILSSAKVTMLRAAILGRLRCQPRYPRRQPDRGSARLRVRTGVDPGTGGDASSCLTAEQVHVVNTVCTGNFDAQGRRLNPRYLPTGSEGS